MVLVKKTTEASLPGDSFGHITMDDLRGDSKDGYLDEEEAGKGSFHQIISC